jgi:hypothetical protein
MHASIWKFNGDTEELGQGYDALMGELLGPNVQLHLCLRADDGILVVDTCPSREVFEGFSQSDEFRGLLARHGLAGPQRLDDFPVHAAFVDGAAR